MGRSVRGRQRAGMRLKAASRYYGPWSMGRRARVRVRHPGRLAHHAPAAAAHMLGSVRAHRGAFKSTVGRAIKSMRETRA